MRDWTYPHRIGSGADPEDLSRDWTCRPKEKRMPDLQPCPFCGSADLTIDAHTHHCRYVGADPDAFTVAVECACGLCVEWTVRAETEDAAESQVASRWNRRPLSDTPARPVHP